MPHRDGRRLLSIEAALSWAYRIELVNAPGIGAGGEPTAMHPMWKGARVNGGRDGWEDAAIARFVDPDALAIAAAVARLRGHELDPPTGLAEADTRMFIAQRGRAETLVICHARLGTRPDLGNLPEPGPLLSPNGRPAVQRVTGRTEFLVSGEKAILDYEANVEPARIKGAAGEYPAGSFCPLVWWPSFESVARDRAERRVWECSLDWLKTQLSALERIEITGNSGAVLR